MPGGRREGWAPDGPPPRGKGRPGYKSFAVTYAATIVATMRTNTLAPNHPWLRNPGPPCACLRPHDMIVSCRQPGPPATFVAARIALSSNRRDPAIRFAAPAQTLSGSSCVYPPDKDFPLAGARERRLRSARFVADSSAWPRSGRGVKQGPAQAGVCGTGRNPPKPAGDRSPLREPVPARGSP